MLTMKKGGGKKNKLPHIEIALRSNYLASHPIAAFIASVQSYNHESMG
jgi:hypothetical protein